MRRVVHLLLVAAAVGAVAGCGGSKHASGLGTPPTHRQVRTNAQAPLGKARVALGSAAFRAAGGVARGHQAKLHKSHVCPPGQAKKARCTSSVATGNSGKPLGFPKPDVYSVQGYFGTIWGFGPKDFHVAYGLPWYAKYQQTIGIVMWNDDPTAKSDLDVFDTTFGLGTFPSCTTWSWAPCFLKVNQRGSPTSFPAPDADASEEISLDVQYTHATCLNCRIILVEADSNDDADLAAAENMAYRLGATEINNSWGAPEDSDSCAADSTTYASSYNHPGVAIVASSGDNGYGVECPADLNTVIAVGGTDLTVNSDSSYASETVYDDEFGAPGSGCSQRVRAAAWQTTASNWAQGGCGSSRGVADVSASYGGAWVYDSSAGPNEPIKNGSINGNATNTYWYLLYGTSLAAPIISGVYGLAGNVASARWPAQLAYQHPGSFRDIQSGSNGNCGTSMCVAGFGYDGPTGLGTPYGLGGF